MDTEVTRALLRRQMVALGEVRVVEVEWHQLSELSAAVSHHLTPAQRRSLELLHQDLSSIEISYNLFAQARSLPITMRESFHHAKCYVSAVKRFHRLMTTLGRDGWPQPVAVALRPLIRRDGPQLDVYTPARNAIEHVDEHGRAAVWWMSMLEEDFAVSKEQDGSEIRVRLVGGEALQVATRFLGQFLVALVKHWTAATTAAPPSQ